MLKLKWIFLGLFLVALLTLSFVWHEDDLDRIGILDLHLRDSAVKIDEIEARLSRLELNNSTTTTASDIRVGALQDELSSLRLNIIEIDSKLAALRSDK